MKTKEMIRPYGDTLNDGKVQLSFSLPIPCNAKGEEAAKKFSIKMGLLDPQVAHSAPLGDQFSFYIVYGTAIHQVDLNEIEVKLAEDSKKQS